MRLVSCYQFIAFVYALIALYVVPFLFLKYIIL